MTAASSVPVRNVESATDSTPISVNAGIVPRAPAGSTTLLSRYPSTAAVAGERWHGAGRQIETFFYLFFGSGPRGGVVIEGRLCEGFTGNASEIRHPPTSLAGDDAADGRTWACPSPGRPAPQVLRRP